MHETVSLSTRKCPACNTTVSLNANFYADGRGVPHNLELAQQWYHKPPAAGDERKTEATRNWLEL